ncbi:hypothetical protein C8R45DRAFT_1111769 [Mycena sanguinolenta]|nr:hypothetical protein C8R45DRAFT_1111769 [Mycena sanguinolenta]
MQCRPTSPDLSWSTATFPSRAELRRVVFSSPQPCSPCLVVVFGIWHPSPHVVVHAASRAAPSSPAPDRVDEDGAEEKDAGMTRNKKARANPLQRSSRALNTYSSAAFYPLILKQQMDDARTSMRPSALSPSKVKGKSRAKAKPAKPTR